MPFSGRYPNEPIRIARWTHATYPYDTELVAVIIRFGLMGQLRERLKRSLKRELCKTPRQLEKVNSSKNSLRPQSNPDSFHYGERTSWEVHFSIRSRCDDCKVWPLRDAGKVDFHILAFCDRSRSGLDLCALHPVKNWRFLNADVPLSRRGAEVVLLDFV